MKRTALSPWIGAMAVDGPEYTDDRPALGLGVLLDVALPGSGALLLSDWTDPGCSGRVLQPVKRIDGCRVAVILGDVKVEDGVVSGEGILMRKRGRKL